MLSIQNAQRTHICGIILLELREKERKTQTKHTKAVEQNQSGQYSCEASIGIAICRRCRTEKKEFHLNGTKVNKTQRNDYITPGSQLNTFTFVWFWFGLIWFDFVSCLVLCIVLYALFHVHVCDLVLFVFDDHESFVEAFSTNRAKKKPPCKCAHILSE